jgi:hypothetical protein
LFFPQLNTIGRKLGTHLAMFSRRISPAIKGALIGIATISFEK